MDKPEIYIFGRDRPYAEALSRYIAGTNTGFKACLLSYDEEAKTHILDQKFVLSDIILPGRYVFLAEGRETDKIQKDGSGEWENPCVYKYLPADVLMDEVRYQIAALHGRTAVATVKVETQRTGLIALASGAGGRGNSVISVAVSRCLAQGGAKVLCLSLEQISAMRIYSGAAADKPPRSISDYLYRVLSGKKVLSENGFTYQDASAVRYFYDEEGLNPLTRLGSEEAELVFAYLTEAEPYDYILVDAADLTTPAAACLITRCSKAILTGDKSPASKWKNRQLRMMISGRENGLPLRIREVINRWDGVYPEEEGETFFLREEEEAFRHTEENTEIMPHSGFTDGIRTICHWIREG